MSTVTEHEARILPGQKIEVPAPDYPVGGTVRVRVEWSPVTEEPADVLQVLERIHRTGPFRTSAEEMDRIIREERDSWDH